MSRRGRVKGYDRDEPHLMYGNDWVKSIGAQMLYQFTEDIEALKRRDRQYFIISHNNVMSDAEYAALRKELWDWLGSHQIADICAALDLDVALVEQRLFEKLETLPDAAPIYRNGVIPPLPADELEAA